MINGGGLASKKSDKTRRFYGNVLPSVFPPHPPDVGSLNLHALSAPIIPIADWQHHDDLASRFSDEERCLRNNLAAFYRLADWFQWSQGIQNNISLRLPDEPDRALMNPFGLLYSEISASNLVKIDMKGRVVDSGSAQMTISQTAFVLHSAVYEARRDVRCIVHLHTPVVAAVSAMKCGLMPICQEAMIVGPVGYHDYQGIVSDESEKKSIVENLGDKDVLILRNHGFVVCAQNIEYALHLTFHLFIACQTQIRAVRIGVENLNMPAQYAVDRAYNMTRNKGIGGSNRNETKPDGEISDADKSAIDATPYAQIGWRVGEMEWEAWMRVLDSTGHNTGHVYRMPALQHFYSKANL